MGDLKTPFSEPAMPPPDLSGSGVTQRGGDPLIDTGGSSGLQPFWGEDKFVPEPPDKETANSVSGLPSTPNRWEPSAASEQPPSLEDRSPGTIDRR